MAASSASTHGQCEMKPPAISVAGPSSGVGPEGVAASGANVAGEKVNVWSGAGRPVDLAGALSARARGGAGVGVGVARSTARLGRATLGAAVDPVGVEPAWTSRGDCPRGCDWACESARRVTVPCSEKSLSCAGPTSSCVEGGGATMIGGAEVAARESWASAGAATPIASATAAGITRNLALMVTRSTGSEAPRALAAATQSLLPSICRHFKHMLDEPQATGDE